MNFRTAIFNVLYLIRLPHVVHFLNMSFGKVPVLLFHDINPNGNKLTGALTPLEFEEIILFIKKKYFIEDLRNFSSTSIKKTCYITFDDGMYSFYKYALKIIIKHKVPVTLFVPSNCITKSTTWNLEYFDYIDKNNANKVLEPNIKNYHKIKEINSANDEQLSEKYRLMTWLQLKKLNSYDLINIQSHSNNHKFLSTLNKKDQKRELLHCKNQIQTNLNKNVDLIAYPMGNFNTTTISVAQKLYSKGFKTGNGLAKPKSINKFKISRITIHNSELKELYFKINGFHYILNFILRRPIK